jgi:hypothetical protein
LENIFTLERAAGYEMVLVYIADVADEVLLLDR